LEKGVLTIHSLDSAEHRVLESIGKDTGHHDKSSEQGICCQEFADFVVVIPKEVEVVHEPGEHLGGWTER